MKVANIRLIQEPDKSFIYKGNCPFTPLHHHPEYELCMITKGRGKRMVGDNIDRFEDSDLVFIGAYTPHEYLCDPKHFVYPDGERGEGIVIQFMKDFLGEDFFLLPENRGLNKFIMESSRGYVFFGESKQIIMSVMHEMDMMTNIERFYSLFQIMKIFATTQEYRILSSPAFSEPFWTEENAPMQMALKHILQNFQENVLLDDLLAITNMSNTSFYSAFKKTYGMSFKDYLLKTRVGYSCKLLIEGSYSISETAYKSGFENISNFNRQFKKIKGITPSQLLEQVNKIETESVKSLDLVEELSG